MKPTDTPADTTPTDTDTPAATWGGARPGAGRKKTRGKTYGFCATPAVEAALEARAAADPTFRRTDYINAAIAAYIAAGH